MKRRINILCLLLMAFCLVLSADTLNRAAMKHKQKYRLIFHDEFNLPDGSQPDSTVWSRCKRYDSVWNRWISSSKEVVYIKNGKLICRAIPNTTEKGDTAKMLTGAIESINKFAFQYGRVDIRLRTNTYRGNFPAAWMKPEVIDPTRYGEIDLFEGTGDMNMAQQTIHNHLSVVLNEKNEKHEFKTELQVGKWHVYSLLWTPNRLVFLIDNEIKGIFEKSKNNELLKRGQWTFDRPFYLILNQSVGDGKYKCLEASLNQIYETQFDWVRVYKIM